MRMKAFCEATGLSRDTVNFYVGRGLLHARPAPNGYRDFDGTQVDRALMILSAKALGFTLGQIAELARRYEAGASDADRAAVLDEQLAELADRRRKLDRIEAALKAKRGALGERPPQRTTVPYLL